MTTIIEPNDDDPEVKYKYYTDHHGNVHEDREYFPCSLCHSNHRHVDSQCNPKQLSWWIKRRKELDEEHAKVVYERKQIENLVPILECFGLEVELSSNGSPSAHIRMK